MIVILHYGDWALTERCLAALGCDEPVTVVMNAPGPDVDGVRVLRPPRNLGFAAGCNLAAEGVTDDLLCFLNNDTVPEPGWWDLLTDPFADPQVAVTGAHLYRPDGMTDRKSTRLNSSHIQKSRMPSSA